MLRKLKWFCFFVGCYKIGEVGFHSFQGFQTYYLTAAPNFQSRYGSKQYALISDSSSELGREFSIALAQNSQNLILLSPEGNDLSKLQSELQTINPNIDVKTFEFNPKNKNYDAYEQLFKNIESTDIGLIVNSSTEKPLAGDFENTTLESVKDEVLSTLLPGTVLINYILPRFQKRKDHSAIINVGSAFGELGNPYYSVSAGNMAFINFLTRSLAHEVGDNVDVLLVTPGPLKKDNVYGEYENFNSDSKTIVQNSLKNIVGKKWIIGCPKQAILYYFLSRMPRFSEKFLVFRGLMNIQGNK